MATKVTILGMDEPKKPIEFVKYINENNGGFECVGMKPSEFENIELIARNFKKDLDLMFVFNERRSGGCLFLGHFNDGIV